MVNGVPEMGAGLHWTFDTSNLASMNSASSSALLTVITSDFERMSSAAPLPVLAGLWLLAHCGHVINRWVEMTSRKIPRNMEQMKARRRTRTLGIFRGWKIFLNSNTLSEK
jgi:hypothetical protein